jgi:hypothetical protein
MTIQGHLIVSECQSFGRGWRALKPTGKGESPSPSTPSAPVMEGARSTYGTVMVVPSPVAVMVNVPAVLDA